MNAGLLAMKKQVCCAYGNNESWVDKVNEMEDSQIVATYHSIKKCNKLFWQRKKNKLGGK